MTDDSASRTVSPDARVKGSTPPLQRHVVVIGGGITGLAAAHRLITLDPHVQVSVFEASDRLGGIIQTQKTDDGFLMEFGPDSFITNKPGGIQLCEELGFSDQLIPTDERYRRSLVLRKGQPLPVPDGFMLMAPAKPWAIATTKILSIPGKVRLLREAVVAARNDDEDESLGSFVRRRFGAEALDRLVQPLVGGIYTSDPEKLSLKATLPRFLEMEQQHGSVIKATLANERNKRVREEESSGSGARYALFVTPKDGLGSLVDALRKKLTDSSRVTLNLNTPVHSIKRQETGWALNLPSQTQLCDSVIVTLPTHQAARLLADEQHSGLAGQLKQIEYASSAIVVSRHRLADFTHPLDAFGLVIPAKENRNTLAISFTSRKFPGRAPDGHVLLRTFVGGAMQPELLNRDDDTILRMVYDDLRDILGMSADPIHSQLARYTQAMPQYHVGHIDRVNTIDGLVAGIPGMQLAGSAYHGVGIPDSIASGRQAAESTMNDFLTTDA